MAIKRKRSCSEFPSPLSNTSSALRDPSQSPTPASPLPSVSTHQNYFFSGYHYGNHRPNWGSAAREGTPSHLDSRTRKRFRDNRPSDEMIYQHTLQKLYSAPKNISPIPPHTQRPPSSTAAKPALPQSSLHAFWSLPQQVVRPLSLSAPSMPRALVGLQTTCEDCDRPLLPSHMDDAMDVDDIPDEDLSCRDCGRRVCEMCAVVADGRTCLECATSERRSFGGICWT